MRARRLPSGELKIPESSVQSQIITFLNRSKIYNNRVNGANFKVGGISKNGKKNYRYVRCNSINGKSDIEAWFFAENDLGDRIGIPVYIEVKASHGGKQSKDQKKFEQEMVDRGYYYIIVNSLDVFIEKIKKIKNDFDSKATGYILNIGRSFRWN